MTRIVKISSQTTSIGHKLCLFETNLQFLQLKLKLFLHPQCAGPVSAYLDSHEITSIELDDDDEELEVATKMVSVLLPDWNGQIAHARIEGSDYIKVTVKPSPLRVKLDNHHQKKKALPSKGKLAAFRNLRESVSSLTWVS
jgi:hypothetical protein